MTISIQKLLDSDQIPSLPEAALRVVELAQEPEPDFDEMLRVIKSDPAICGRIMKTVNSALFGLRKRVSSLDAALPVLGANLVRTLVLSFSLANHHGPSIRYRRSYQDLWRSSITQAVAAETLAHRLPGVDESIWFLGGLLQDIGRMVLLTAAPEEYSRMVSTVRNGTELIASEERTFGFQHVEVAVQLAIRWRLDNYLVDAIGKHHTEARATSETTVAPTDFTLPYLPNALRCAALLADYIEGLRANQETDGAAVAKACQDAFDIAPNDLRELIAEIDQRTNEVAALFDLDLGESVPVEQILARAQSTLAKIALQSQLEVVAVQRHIEEAKRELQNARLESATWKTQAQRDDLTGAFARKTLNDSLLDTIDQCIENERLLGLMFVDLDSFKYLNDNFGHQLGDEALQAVVEAIRGTLRDADRIVRYGGDEFVVIMMVSVGETFVRVAERMRSRIGLIRFGDEPQARVSCSLGGIVWNPGQSDAKTPEQLVEEADQAMYLAKQRGGNQCVLLELSEGQRRPLNSSSAPTLAFSSPAVAPACNSPQA